MNNTKTNNSLRFFWVSGLLTAVIGGLILAYLGPSGLWLFLILVVMEVTFSFDNAVVNSKILTNMSPFWQKLFLTVGIILAVFIVRFLLPIFIVMLSSGIGFMEVINMALYDSVKYGETLHNSAPIINAFGGTFLIMIGISYFMDLGKEIHWLGRIEKWLSKFGEYESLKILIMLVVAMALYFTVHDKYRVAILLASIIGTMLHIALDLFGKFASSKQTTDKQLVGMSAFAAFVYLNILDASFSLDGVIGAFAISNSVTLIIAGLGAGALWVRSLTVYLVRTGTLGKYRYLEHGAHWAILALGVVMIVKLYHVEPPEWAVGSLGMVFIITAVVSSIISAKSEICKSK